jgi:hypothetical protein
MPFCNDGTNDMFEKREWDMDQYIKDCRVSREDRGSGRKFKAAAKDLFVFRRHGA